MRRKRRPLKKGYRYQGRYYPGRCVAHPSCRDWHQEFLDAISVDNLRVAKGIRERAREHRCPWAM